MKKFITTIALALNIFSIGSIANADERQSTTNGKIEFYGTPYYPDQDNNKEKDTNKPKDNIHVIEKPTISTSIPDLGTASGLGLMITGILSLFTALLGLFIVLFKRRKEDKEQA